MCPQGCVYIFKLHHGTDQRDIDAVTVLLVERYFLTRVAAAWCTIQI